MQREIWELFADNKPLPKGKWARRRLNRGRVRNSKRVSEYAKTIRKKERLNGN